MTAAAWLAGLLLCLVSVRGHAQAESASQARPQPLAARAAVGTDPSSPHPGYRSLWFSLALFHPLDTNALEQRRAVINHLSLNIFYGRAAIAEGLQLGAGVHHLTERLVGAQLAAAGNAVEGQVEGVQLSLGVNLAGRYLRGAQLTGGLNWVDDDVTGLQLAAGANLAGRRFEGAQVAAGFNAVRRLHGFQLAVGLNAVDFLEGFQLGGVNLAREIAGLQLGLVNIGGRVRGLQLGLVNYAEEAEVQVGLLGVSRRHGVALQAWTSDSALLSTAVRFNAGLSYGLLSVGLHPFGGDDGYSLGLGFGGSGELNPRLGIDVDASIYSLQWGYDGLPFGDESVLVQLRGLLRIQLSRRLSLIAGPTFNLLMQFDPQHFGRRPGYDYRLGRTRSDNKEVAFWPGLVAGVQLL